MKLHLGCGRDLKEGYINIDAQLPCDVQHDFRNPLPYEDNSVDEIYSDDVIQIFSREEWKKIKKDWVRVLKPGGILKISCWDFPWVLRTYLLHPEVPYNIQRIYAGQVNEWDYIKNGFSYESLVHDLKEEGMDLFERKPYEQEFIHLICVKS